MSQMDSRVEGIGDGNTSWGLLGEEPGQCVGIGTRGQASHCIVDCSVLDPNQVGQVSPGPHHNNGYVRCWRALHQIFGCPRAEWGEEEKESNIADILMVLSILDDGAAANQLPKNWHRTPVGALLNKARHRVYVERRINIPMDNFSNSYWILTHEHVKAQRWSGYFRTTKVYEHQFRRVALEGRPKLGYVVLPPGHGKSFLHLREPWLLEADKIYDCEGDDVLKELRLRAKNSGYWNRYNQEWAGRLKRHKPNTEDRLIIMVPSREIGQAIGGDLVFAGCLCLSQWQKNLDDRNEKITKYVQAWDGAVEYSKVYSNNNELQYAMMYNCLSWLGLIPSLRSEEDGLRVVKTEAQRDSNCAGQGEIDRSQRPFIDILVECAASMDNEIAKGFIKRMKITEVKKEGGS